jgi:hypothetical protein
MPYAHGGRTTPENLYPACRRCNSMLGAKVFRTIQEKSEYARKTLIAAGQWNGPNMPELPDAIPEEAPPSLLLAQVPMGRLAGEKDTGIPGRFERRKFQFHGREFVFVTFTRAQIAP